MSEAEELNDLAFLLNKGAKGSKRTDVRALRHTTMLLRHIARCHLSLSAATRAASPASVP
jgi:hypothetical protein